MTVREIKQSFQLTSTRKVVSEYPEFQFAPVGLRRGRSIKVRKGLNGVDPNRGPVTTLITRGCVGAYIILSWCFWWKGYAYEMTGCSGHHILDRPQARRRSRVSLVLGKSPCSVIRTVVPHSWIRLSSGHTRLGTLIVLSHND